MFKFTKKKGAGDSAPVEKESKSKASKSQKLSKASSASGGFKEFFINHTEKLIFGLIVSIMGFLVYDGTQTKSYPTDRQPDDLVTKTSKVKTEIETGDHWQTMAGERKVETKFPEEVDKSRRPTDPARYPSYVFENTPREATSKRGDPELVRPGNIVGYSMTAAIAKNSKVKRDPLADLASASVVDFRKKKDGSTAAAGGSPYGGGGGGGSPYGGGAPGAPGGAPGGKGKDEKESSPRFLNRKFDHGFGTGGGAAGPANDSGTTLSAPSEKDRNKSEKGRLFQVAEAATFNSVLALAPYAEQMEKYKSAFEKSAGYNPDRDTPYYVGFEVQRVDVTDDPLREIQDGEWKDLANASSKSILKMRETWAGESAECVHKEHLNYFLTMPLPPVLLRDYRQIAKHPLTPFSDEARAAAAAPPASGGGDYPMGGGAPAGGGAPPGSAGGGSPYGGGGGGYPTGGGNPAGGGAPPGSAGGGNPYGGGAPGGNPYGGGGAPPGSAGGGNPYGGGGAPGGGAPGGGAPAGGLGGMVAPKPAQKVTKHLLVRFYDFEVESGRSYKYRVRLLVEDVNYPENPASDPPLSALRPDTLKRIYDLKAADQATADKAKPGTKLTRSFSRQTEWSDSSPAIRVSYPFQAYIADSKLVPVREADVVSVEWDARRAVDVPKRETKAVRGTVFSGTVKSNPTGSKGAEIVNPLTKAVLIDDKYRFNSVATILDMLPGEQLGLSDRKDPLLAMGELCILDPSTGEINVTNELESFEPFRMYSFVEEIEAAEKIAESARKSDQNSGAGGAPGAGRPGMGGGGGSGNN